MSAASQAADAALLAPTLPLRPTLLRVALFPALVLALFAVLLIWQVGRLLDELQWVTHTDTVLAQADNSLIDVLSVQTALRSYLITGTQEDLDAYRASREPIGETTRKLTASVADNPEQVRSAEQVTTIIGDFLQYAEFITKLKAQGGDLVSALSTGERLMESLRRALQDFAGHERTLRTQRRTAVRTIAMYILASGLMLLLAGGFVFAFVARRELRTISETYQLALTTATQDRSRLEEARDAAEAANRAKDQFLAMVSHELRNPLTPILTWVVLLRDPKLGTQQYTRGLDSIERSARSLTQLIDDLLDVSRIVAGKLRLDVRTVELAPVINAALEAARPAADAKQVRLYVVLDPRAGPIAGDAERLQQIVWNLLSNAIKFTPRGGRVHVALARVNSNLELSVSDTGQGIDATLLPHVFERFWQAESGSTRQRAGLGLGLSIVRHLAELHGGSVEAQSDGLGQGSVFKVLLPMLPTARAAGSGGDDASLLSDHARPATDTLAGVRVLVVDDDPTSLEAVGALLSRSGAEVRTAHSTAAALASMRQWRPDVLLSDIEMPGQDGYALIRSVRASPPAQGGDIPAVALTAYARVDDRVRVLSAGFQMHVIKPADPAELVAVVASLSRVARPL